MKRNLLILLGYSSIVSLLFGQTSIQAVGAARSSKKTNFSAWLQPVLPHTNSSAARVTGTSMFVTDRGASRNVWSKVTTYKDEKGNTHSHTNVAYVELGTGMNFKDSATGRWIPAREQIDAYPGGAIAQNGQNRVLFSANLNNPGAIDLQTKDGEQIRSHVLGLSYFDLATSNSVLIAEVKDSTGQILGSNQVIYADVFNGVKADVRYTYKKGGLEQDIVLREQPPSPESFGLKSARLQVLTEFETSNPPKVTPHRAGREKDSDEDIAFGALKMRHGAAFILGQGRTRRNAKVAKQFVQIDGRSVLIESVPFDRVRSQIQMLPPHSTAYLSPSPDNALAKVSLKRLLPPNAAANSNKVEMRLAKNSQPGNGYVIDYNMESGEVGDFTFESGTTYLIGTQGLFIDGTATFEGGAIIKDDDSEDTGGIEVDGYDVGSVVFKSNPYNPVIFTSKNDDSVGDIIAGSTGQPTQLMCDPLQVYNEAFTNEFQCARFEHAEVALQHDAETTVVRNCQFLDCGEAIANYSLGGDMELYNVLFSGCGWGIETVFQGDGADFQLYAQNITVDGSGLFFQSDGGAATVSFQAQNCIFSSVSGMAADGTSISGNNNGFYNTPQFGTSATVTNSSPFQTAGQGNYYLGDGNSFSGKGTTNVNVQLLSDLKKGTTHPPIAFPPLMEMAGDLTLFPQIARYTNGAPDIGYYYPALDYTVATLIIDGNVTIEPGTAVGVRNDSVVVDDQGDVGWTTVGFGDEEGSSFISHGTPVAPVTYVSASMVQEEPNIGYTQQRESPFAPPYDAVFFVPDFHLGVANLDVPKLDFRFCNFFLPGMDYHFWAGYDEFDFYNVSLDAAVNLGLRDCNLFGGKLVLGKNPDESTVFGSGVLSLTNNLFNRVAVAVDPDWIYEGDPTLYVNLACYAYNNLFRGGAWFHLDPLPAESGNNWVFENNLFDQVDFFQNASEPLDFDYNAYWPRTIYPGGNDAAELVPTTTGDGFTDGSAGNHEVILSSAPPYQSGPFGDFYLPSTTPLYGAGNGVPGKVGTPGDTGLAQYTTLVDQTKELGKTAVDIGLHYVATASSASRTPLDSDVGGGDGVPDYIEDANGNGDVDADETDWRSQMTDGSTLDSLSTVYDDYDLDADGLDGRVEKAFGKNPQQSDTPVVISGLGQNSVISGEVSIPVAPASLAGTFDLFVNGQQAETATVYPNQGEWTVDWDTSTLPNGTYILQPVYHYSAPSSDPAIGAVNRVAFGPLVEADIENPITFEPLADEFTDELFFQGTFNSTPSDYTVNIYTDDQSHTLLATKNVSAVGNQISDSWDFTSLGISVTTGLDCEFTPQQQGGISPNTAQQVFHHKYFLVGPAIGNSFTLAWGWDQGTQQQLDNRSLDVLFGLVNMLGTDLNGNSFDLLPDGPGGNVVQTSSFQLLDDSASHDTLTNAIAKPASKNFFFWGHGFEDGFGPTQHSSDPGQVKASEIAAQLGNLPGKHVYPNPYQFVFMDACGTYSRQMVNAFGIPFDKTGHGAKVSDYNAWHRPPRAFVGWDVAVQGPEIDCEECDSYRVQAQQAALSYWQAGNTVFKGMGIFDLYIYDKPYDSRGSTYSHIIPGLNPTRIYSPANTWKISGCWDLTRYPNIP